MDRSTRTLSEVVRQLIRGLAPRGLYAAVSISWDWSLAVRKLGWRQSCSLWRAKFGTKSKSNALITVQSSVLLHPFCLRSAETDIPEFLYTAVRETYGKYLPNDEVNFILDAGANNGDTVAYLLTRFPNTRLIAVEPDPGNFALLKTNCAPYGQRVEVVQAAVWPTPALLSLKGSGAKDAIQVVDDASGSCAGITIPELMKRNSFPHLDIFKCDIEGAELNLFSENSDEWLSRTRFIVIEVHGSECLKAVVGATSRHKFSHREFRNLHIFARSWK